MEQLAKLERTWNLASFVQIIEKVPENYCPYWYLSTGQVWWLNELWFKRYIPKMHRLSCTNADHDVTDLVNHEIVKNTKTWISWERYITFLPNKKIPNLCLWWHIFRSYHFVAEVIFKLWDPCKKRSPYKIQAIHKSFINTIKINLKNLFYQNF